MKMKFRDTSGSSDIIGLVKNSDEKNTIIWQTLDGNRKVYNVQDIQYNEVLKTVKITLKDYADDLLIDEVIYVKLSYRETLFKARVINLSGDILSLYLPSEVKTLELRENPRVKFKPKDDKNITLRIESELASVAQRLQFKVVDISEAGVSILVSDENKSYVESAQNLYLTHLGETELIVPMLVDLKYIQRLHYRKNGKVVISNRAGFSFINKIAKSDLTFFTRKITS